MAETPASGRGFGGGAPGGAAVTGDAVSEWFVREIVPLETKLMHYLRHNWRNASDIADLRQEVYARVLAGARERLPDDPERFLFVCARNLLINMARREQVVPMEAFADIDALGVASDAPAPDRLLIEREELGRLEAALAQLPPRTREAIELAYFEGLSGREIAKRMGVSPPTAWKFLSKGTLILADILYGPEAGGSAKS